MIQENLNLKKVFEDAIGEILTNIKKFVKIIDVKSLEHFIWEFVNVKMNNGRIFIHGAGRSGLVGKAFGMRLVHLGFNVYIVGETITPAIAPNDLLICISGSGRTKTVVQVATIAKQINTRIIAITSNKQSPLGELSDWIIEIPGRSKDEKREDYLKDQLEGFHAPLTPLGTLFEDTTQLFLDAFIVVLMQKFGKKEEDLKAIHTNLE